jgi:S-DNA-T family DNA segregation ATPase FtsK/SpoIIIE
MRLTLTVDTGERRTDVLVDTDEEATVAALAAQLAHSCGAATEGLFFAGAQLPPEMRLAEAGLVDGAVIGLGTAVQPPPAPTVRGWQLHVVGGPAAGTVLALPVGEHELGREAAVSFPDPRMSGVHALLSVRRDGATLTDLGSLNGTAVDGRPLEPRAAVPVAPGNVLALGDSLITIRAAREADAATEAAEPGRLAFLRPPRMLPFDRPATILLPEAPSEQHKRRFPVATMVAPLALGIVMALMVHSPMYLLFALGSPLMMLGNYATDRRSGVKDHRKALADYLAALAAAQVRLDDAIHEEQLRRRAELPDAAETLLTCRLPGRRLWERRRTDTDALVLRVGVADLPSTVKVESGRQASADNAGPHLLHAVPVPVPLRKIGVLGLAGPRPAASGVLRWLVVQLAAYHAPRDLTLTLLTTAATDEWTWWMWLPHARPRDVEGYVAAVGNDAETVTARVAELLTLVRGRQELIKKSGRVEAEYFAAHVVVVDGARELRATPGLASLLEDGPAVGVYAICADQEERLLPESCTATVVVDPEEPARLELRRTGMAPLRDVLAEPVGDAWAAAVARALAPFKDVATEDGDVTLPDSVRLLDTLSLEPPTVDGVRARWLLDGSTTAMTLGAGMDGHFTVDLRRDGPHGLIAGTTGSGKSELLQTIIASLAVANRPEAMNFVLVDYKGGSAFKDCAFLPHTVGLVTDLDSHLVERALTSLGAELKFREHVLAAAAVKDIDDYLDLRVKDPSHPPLPRLLIVIDEFASMARELPDFVKGLVNIAQRGRSLGIHLILATQRPSGVVSPEIRANTNLRISLRVTDASDSTDVLEAPDAARIPKSVPGRGYARLGAGALVPFQAGRVGGRRPGAVTTHVPPPFVAPLSWKHLGYLAPTAPAGKANDDVEVTDLSVLVDAIRRAADADGSPPQRSPWLDPLPDHLLLDDVPAVEGFRYGLTDLPHQQARRAAAFDPARDGHLLVLGSARSGRSQLLRTLAGSIGDTASARDVHLYAVDCGNGALLPLKDLPHCGAVVTRTQAERATRLLTRLEQEMERRQQLLSESGYADVSEQRRSAAEPLPRLLLLVDRWEGFNSTLGEVDGGRLTEIVLAILREGASVGVHAVITGDRSLGSTRIAGLSDNKIALKLADKADYSLIGLNPKHVPDALGPGRAFALGSGAETQVALLAADDSGQAQAAALAVRAAAANSRDGDLPRGLRPFRVEMLPNRIGFEAAWELLPEGLTTPFALIGVGGDEVRAVGTDFAGGNCFIVAGPGRSGRSTALATIVRSLVRTGGTVVIAAPRRSPLWELGDLPGVAAVVRDGTAPGTSYLDALRAAGDGPAYVVVDDGEVVRDCPAGDFFRDVVKGALPGASLVLGGNADGICTGLSGWQVEARKSRQGLLLSPQGMSDGDLIGVRLPRSAIGQPVQPGRGFLHLGDSHVLTVAVASE